MKKVSAFLVFVGVLAVAACSSTGGGDEGNGCGGGCGGGGTDMTDTMIENTTEATYWVQVHDDVQAGQYWETSSEMMGTVTTTRWQVASVDGDMAVIENQTKSDGEYSSYNYVIAYEVDLTVEEGANVNKAWIGKPGEAPADLPVMEQPDATDGDGTEVESTTEDFEREIADGTWTGTLTTTVVNGNESKTWVADNGWFGGMVRMKSGDMVIELSAWGDDAEPLLAWE